MLCDGVPVRHSVGVIERELLPVPHCDGDNVPERLPLVESDADTVGLPVGLPEIELVRHSVDVGEIELLPDGDGDVLCDGVPVRHSDGVCETLLDVDPH